MNTTAPLAPALAYDAEPTTELVEIRRDGQYVTTVTRGSSLMAWFHQNCPMSMHWALENEGYSIHEVPERFVVFAENNAAPDTIIAIKATRLAAKRAMIKFGKSDEAQAPTLRGYGWRVEIAHNCQWVTA